MKSKHSCPVCNKPLAMTVGENGGTTIIWCGWGRCENQAANDGFIAKSEDEAFVGLVRAIEDAEEDND